MATRVLSGIQPSGKPHLGNYFGAIKKHIELQDRPGVSPFYFIADFHALTTVHDPALLRQYTQDVAVDYLALGLDPDRATLFRQSDVAEVTELAWMLGCVTGMGLLERAHSYKDKVDRGIKPSVGLFYYPVLMAADILIYKPRWVPVGQDQLQHIEMAQDMAAYFNNRYQTEVFPRPEPLLSEAPRVPGTDGEKMSKSYGNTIDLDLEGQELRGRVLSIRTDSTPLEAPKDPETCTVFTLYRLLASDDEREEMARRYRAGGYGYGQAKHALADRIEAYFAPYRRRRNELLANRDFVSEVLRRGAERAREVASQTLLEAQRAAGIR
jgi:tryptophanyl-tRNA synthetase